MSVIQMNNHQFNEAVFQGDKPVLVEFWAPWCVYCRRITPAMNKVAEQYGKNLTVAQINIDDEPMLANQEQIEVIPTLILYKNGYAVDSVVAPESKAKIDEFINAALG